MIRRHGIPVWYSDTNIIGSQQWHNEIGDALRRCDCFAVVMSPNSIESTWVRRELVYALRKPQYENNIVPILYQDCEIERLSWVLESLQIVDYTKGIDIGNVDLMRVWGYGYRPI
jgi:hypothetical protein